MIGEQVNNYRIISLLGEGGMGAVYLAEHPFMGRKAAIKVLRRELAEDRGLVERFMNEARAANAIRHPNIIDIIDVGQLPSGIPYLMMEFLDGESLAARIAGEGRMTVADAADVARQTASALFAAHGKGIVHRDLKPDNLYLVTDDAQPVGRVKVLDFGIAKLRGDLSGSGAATQVGSLMGTPPYMSPEQCRGISDLIDHRTDVYALGIILYEMLTGTPPFVSEGWGDVVLMHLSQPPPPLRALNPEVSLEVEAVIGKALAKKPEQRWSSMAELEVALRKAVPPLSPSGRRRAVAATGAAGPALLPVPTTLRSVTGQLATDPNAGRGSEGAANLGARSWWRRPAVIAFGVVVAAAVSVALGAGRRSPERAGTAAPAGPVEPAATTAPPLEKPPAPPAVAVPTAPTTAKESTPEEHEPPSGHPARPAGGRQKAKREAMADRNKKLPQRTESQVVSPAPQPRAKPVCDPNFYLDAQGEKHFKPECF
ncbi:MAG TPA: serine/threonine-protein kinase [Polyangia bacterium]|nr:serine/threonine-protein kinase [Polyangia bacterium]